jgi:hypothetical protein
MFRNSGAFSHQENYCGEYHNILGEIAAKLIAA